MTDNMATRALQADTEGMENVRADCSILVLHDQHTDPRAFLQRMSKVLKSLAVLVALTADMTAACA